VKTASSITGRLAGFLRSGLAITVATRDDELEPDGAWGWAVDVHEDGRHVTLFLHEAAAAAMLRNLERHPEIAAVLDQPTSHRACQIKGRFVSSRPARDAERATVEGQVELLRADLASIGIPPAMTAGWQLWPCVAIEVRVEQLFEQTPGPGAGEPIP
jgi:hypothetical protein